MYNIKRKAEIVTLLKQCGEVDVNGLSLRFGISRETIRRDLSELEREGILIRTHGGALSNHGEVQKKLESPVDVRSVQQHQEKNAIARYAAGLIREGDLVFVDNSSTTTYLAQYFPRHIHATVITNSLQLLLEAAKVMNPNISYICFGGIFKERNLSFYGSSTVREASEYYPDKAFVSCAGIDTIGRVTDGSVQETDVKRLMLKQAGEVHFLIDHTKFRTNGQVFLTQLGEEHRIITDQQPEEEMSTLLSHLGTQLMVV